MSLLLAIPHLQGGQCLKITVHQRERREQPILEHPISKQRETSIHNPTSHHQWAVKASAVCTRKHVLQFDNSDARACSLHCAHQGGQRSYLNITTAELHQHDLSCRAEVRATAAVPTEAQASTPLLQHQAPATSDSAWDVLTGDQLVANKPSFYPLNKPREHVEGKQL